MYDFKMEDGHNAIEVTELQRKNLAQLSAYLLNPAVDPDFTMAYFSRGDNPRDVWKHVNSCGTVGCALGHGPMAGIRPDYEETWVGYGVRAFGCIDYRDEIDIPMSIGGPVWDWCFDEDWYDTDNTAIGAGGRIAYMLEHGTPAKFTSADDLYQSRREE
jgi:hypothetical protein